MAHLTRNSIPKLPKAPQPPLSHPGATPDSDRAKRPSLAQPAAGEQELTPGDLENSAQLSEQTKMTRKSNGMMTVV